MSDTVERLKIPNDYNAMVAIPLDKLLGMYDILEDRYLQLWGTTNNLYEFKDYIIAIGNCLSLYLTGYNHDISLMDAVELTYDDLYSTDFLTDEDVFNIVQLIEALAKCFPTEVVYVRYVMQKNNLAYWYCSTDIEQSLLFDNAL